MELPRNEGEGECVHNENIEFQSYAGSFHRKRSPFLSEEGLFGLKLPSMGMRHLSFLKARSG